MAATVAIWYSVAEMAYGSPDMLSVFKALGSDDHGVGRWSEFYE